MSKLIRHPFVRDGVGVIPLTKGYEAIVDISMLTWIGHMNWSIDGCNPKYTMYAVTSVSVDGKQKSLRLHNAVLRLNGVDVPKGLVTDHINRNSLDNRFENLRVTTQSMNVRNTERYDNASGVRSYKTNAGNKRYQVRVKSNGREYALGSYSTEEEAHEVYTKELERLQGPLIKGVIGYE